MTNFTKLMFATLIGLLMIGSAAAQNKSNVLGLKTSNTRSEINETFDSGMPDDWTVVDNGSTENVELWHVTDNYESNDNSYSLNGTKFAFINSDVAGENTTVSAYLVSPEIDNTALSNVVLEFDQFYKHYENSFSKVEVWDGSEWQTVLEQTSTVGSFTSPDNQSIDVTAYKNANFKIRFNYYGEWTWYWAIDNVKVAAGIASYPLYLAGVQVNTTNISNLSTINGVDGTVTYDATTKTLTLDNATISGGNVYLKENPLNVAIFSNIEDLTINLTGNNTLSPNSSLFT